MRNYFLSFVLLLFSYPLFSQTAALSSYCNEIYDFCVYYPHQYFDTEKLLDNKEGAILSSPQNDYRLKIMGVANVNDWTTKELYYHTFEFIITSNPENRLISANIDPAFCIVESIIDGRKKYFEARMEANYYIITELSIPESTDEAVYQDLLSKLGIANLPIEK